MSIVAMIQVPVVRRAAFGARTLCVLAFGVGTRGPEGGLIRDVASGGFVAEVLTGAEDSNFNLLIRSYFTHRIYV